MDDKYEAIIGLEIHVQLKTASKMFCLCDNTGEEQPVNTTICPICTGQPGVLPVPNEKAIHMGIMAARALECRIPTFSKFDRKSYFYPDLPKGYQISQYDEPVGVDGHVTIHVGEHEHRVGITRLHLEEDAAKLNHPDGKPYSIVDYNRAGTPLAEIVTEPDIRSPAEAKAFLQELRLRMRYLGVSDADMEKGHVRCDANISLRPRGQVTLSPKTEVKNLNSFRSVERALQYEIERQREMWENGAPESIQSTRGWDDARNETVLQRTKEQAPDYRYFPEPDIPPMNFTNEFIREIDALLPELPGARRERFHVQYGIATQDIEILVTDKELGEYYEQVISEANAWYDANKKDWASDAAAIKKHSANWLINRLQKVLVDARESITTTKITPENFAEFITYIQSGTLNNQTAGKVLGIMSDTGRDPSDIIEKEGLGTVQDEGELDAIVQKVLKDHPAVVEEYRGGKQQVLQFLVGQVMKATQGKANPAMIRELIQRHLT